MAYDVLVKTDYKQFLACDVMNRTFGAVICHRPT